MDYKINDFTVISEWESFTNDLTAVLRRWCKDLEKCPKESTLPFKNVALSVCLIQNIEIIPILSSIPRHKYSLHDEFGRLAKALNIEGKFIILKCADSSSVMSLPTARLILSSLFMGATESGIDADIPLLVEYEDGNVFGVVRSSDKRYNLRYLVSESNLMDEFLLLKNHSSLLMKEITTSNPPIHSYSVSLFRSFRETLLRFTDDSRLGLGWGCFQSVIDTLETVHIFPRLDQTANELTNPNPWDAPILMLSATHSPIVKGRLSILLEEIVDIYKSSLQVQTSISEFIHSKALLPSIPSLPANDKFKCEPLIRFAFFGKVDTFPLRLVNCILYILAATDAPLLTRFSRISLFWKQVHMTLIEYWESLQVVPDIGRVEDIDTCTMLEEKLLMLNKCIEKEHYFNSIPGYSNTSKSPLKSVESALDILVQIMKLKAEEEDDDEFFDAIEEIDEKEIEAIVKALPTNRIISSTFSPDGRKELLSSDSDDNDIWIPYTQDFDDTQTSIENQCNQLISDMQAFKAANPSAPFSSFLKWHSPRDVLGDATLSTRMSTPGNAWQRFWDACGPIPVVKQPLLFDHLREAQRILFWFEEGNIQQLLSSVLPLSMELFVKILESDVTLIVPPCIDEESLKIYSQELSRKEYDLSLRKQVKDVFKMPIEIITEESILVAGDGDRSQLRWLMEKATIMERHLISESDDCIVSTRLFDSLLEIGIVD